MPAPMPAQVPSSFNADALAVVGGMSVGVPRISGDVPGASKKRRHGQRGPDKDFRKKRGPAPPCKRCTEFGGSHGSECKGRGGRIHCEHFDVNGACK